MFFLVIIALFVLCYVLGNYFYNLYNEDKYEQNTNACTYDDYKLAEKMAQ